TYSYPFLIQYYEDIANNFPGGLYQYVRVVSFRDTRPFEHEVFIEITQSFPLMDNLSANNRQSEN
ncbi:unnamed protein product, partial [Rotaria magnacalcarata]